MNERSELEKVTFRHVTTKQHDGEALSITWCLITTQDGTIWKRKEHTLQQAFPFGKSNAPITVLGGLTSVVQPAGDEWISCTLEHSLLYIILSGTLQVMGPHGEIKTFGPGQNSGSQVAFIQVDGGHNGNTYSVRALHHMTGKLAAIIPSFAN